jgi:hypothetical protein
VRCRPPSRTLGHRLLINGCLPIKLVWNLPAGASVARGRRLAAIESSRGSTGSASGRGLGIGKRQVEQLAYRAAVDFEGFCATRERPAPATDDVLVLSADGKGIAEVSAVYEIAPAVRTAADVLATAEEKTTQPPRAKGKWLTASIRNDAASVLADIFAEAERRDPEHRRTWVALFDGNNHQFDRINKEAKARKVKVAFVVDLIHVLQYLWSSAWCFYREGDSDAETRVHEKATAILEGRSGIGAASIRRKATHLQLDGDKRPRADRAANYLLNKRRYLDDPTALDNGWPIATGIFEGACRHLIKDRMDITSARGASKEPKRSSSSARSAAITTSTTTGPTTSSKNATATTNHATPTASSRQRHDVPPGEPHPFKLASSRAIQRRKAARLIAPANRSSSPSASSGSATQHSPPQHPTWPACPEP